MIAFKKFEDLKQKFIDKGDLQAFGWLVLPPPPFDNSRLMGSYEENIKSYSKVVEKVYGEHWDEMSVWIDHQNYK